MKRLKTLLAFAILLAPLSGSVQAQVSQESGKAAKSASTEAAAKKTDPKAEKSPSADEASAAESAKKSVQWAEIKLSGALPEGPSLPGLFGELSESLNRIFERLDQAGNDKKISAIVLRIENPQIGLGNVHELRSKIQAVKKSSGKPVYALLETAMTTDYLIATACDKIYMPEPGLLMLTGLRAEVTFYKDLFEKLDIEADVLRVGKFKSAAEPFTRSEMSPEFRQELEEILDGQFNLIVNTIAESRKLTPEQVEQAINSGPHVPSAAKEFGLIDEIRYADELEEIAKSEEGVREFKLVERYGRKKVDTNFDGFSGMIKMMNLLMGVDPNAKRSTASQVAVIYASGAIISGRGTSGPFGEDMIGSETMVAAINEAAANKRVKAIVLRVNSPGGSAVASDIIWRALEKVDKPIVVSMGNVAASGGYYISMGADYIYAEPGTITGSIGVVGGKLALEGLFKKLGMNTSVVSRGENSGALSVLNPFSDSERAAMQKMMNEIYEVFTRKAAEGRKMEQDKLKELAGGRIYTGVKAAEIGLIDEVGTLDQAVAKAVELAKLDPENFERLLLPKPTSPFEQMFGPLDAETRSRVATQSVEESVRAILPGALVEKLKHAASIQQLSESEPRLLLMPFLLEVK